MICLSVGDEEHFYSSSIVEEKDTGVNDDDAINWSTQEQGTAYWQGSDYRRTIFHATRISAVHGLSIKSDQIESCD